MRFDTKAMEDCLPVPNVIPPGIKRPISYEYDPFGKQLISSGPLTQPNRYRFSTKEQDATQLEYFGMRCFSPTLAKWTSRDPSGEGGGHNLHAFVPNSPLAGIDPLGLYAVTPPAPVITYTDPPSAAVVRWTVVAGGGSHTVANSSVTCTCDLGDNVFCAMALQPMIYLEPEPSYNMRGRYGHEQLHVCSFLTLFSEVAKATESCVDWADKQCGSCGAEARRVESLIKTRWAAVNSNTAVPR